MKKEVTTGITFYDSELIAKDLRMAIYIRDGFTNIHQPAKKIGIGWMKLHQIMAATSFVPKLMDFISVCDYIQQPPARYLQPKTITEKKTVVPRDEDFSILW